MMNKIKGFFFNRSNWLYFRVIFLVFIAGVITGLNVPHVSLIISFKHQPLTDWIVAVCSIGIFLIAFITKNQWLKQKDLENHTEFCKAFHHYFLLKSSTVSSTNKTRKLKQELNRIKDMILRQNIEKQKSTQLALNNKQSELELFEKSLERFYLEMDQAKEKMLVLAGIIRVNRKKINGYAVSLATYNNYDIASDFDKFRNEINEMYLDIQRIYFSESELIHLPE